MKNDCDEFTVSVGPLSFIAGKYHCTDRGYQIKLDQDMPEVIDPFLCFKTQKDVETY